MTCNAYTQHRKQEATLPACQHGRLWKGPAEGGWCRRLGEATARDEWRGEAAGMSGKHDHDTQGCTLQQPTQAKPNFPFSHNSHSAYSSPLFLPPPLSLSLSLLPSPFLSSATPPHLYLSFPTPCNNHDGQVRQGTRGRQVRVG
ncbi:hypothetical protein E2C01_006082 [Portunus trituberculatus]|uniref:Uncharacterized protein n=1 Tax=Portunus trituberculatus TaxID=210409 RepID=A0A5B7CVE1_PORTR|nr:hypothetical protein [Portunus trituberculatus]